MSDLSLIEVELLGMDTPEKLLALRQKLDFAKGVLKTLEALWGEKALEIVEKGGSVPCGDMLYCITTDKSYRPLLKAEEAAQRILETAGPKALFNCLSSSAIKPGQLREELAQAGCPASMFDEFFEQVEKKSVEGKPVRRVSAVNTKFIAAKSA